MQREAGKRILARPALHAVLGLIFLAVFCWPIFAISRPAHTFKLLHAAWLVSLVALAAVSRGVAARPDEDEAPDEVGRASEARTP